MRARRILLQIIAGSSLLGAMPALARAQQAPATLDSIRAQVAQWYERASASAPGTWGIAVADQQGTLIWSEQPDIPLIPASTVKLLTTGYARTVLGTAARRSTRVLGTGRIDEATGMWVGSWALELNGDPSLERPGAQGPSLVELAQRLHDAGIRKLTGPFRVVSAEGPADAWYPPAWSPRHRGRLFAPPIGPVTLHENVVSFTIVPGVKAGRTPTVGWVAPAGIEQLITVKARTVSGRVSRIQVQPRGDGGWLVTGSIGTRARPRGISQVTQDPKAVLQAVWSNALTQAGIEWTPATSGMVGLSGAVQQTLAEIQSPPFDSLATEVNRRSLNYGAELLLQWAGGRYGAPDKLTQHVQSVTGIRDGVYLVDGSGLSYDDRVSPSTFIQYLAKFPNTAAGKNFPQLLPANGTGTLRRLNSGLPGQGVVRAKTGTLGMVSTVVGYLGRADGVLLVSLMYNGPRVYAARQAQWKLFRLLGADGVVIPTDSIPTPDTQLGGQ